MKSFIKVIGIILGLTINVKACTIVNPTYDKAFKTLFGDSDQSIYEGITAKGRLINFLNSLLNENPFNIQVVNLEYKPTEINADREKEVEFDLFCECKCEGKTKFINIEMQKRNIPYFIQRMTFYGARILSVNASQASQYSELPQVIIISILDCILDGYINQAVFYVAPSFHSLVTLGSQQPNNQQEGKVVDTNLIHLCVQLPYIAFLTKSTDHIMNNNQYVQNPWLKLLASGRICSEQILNAQNPNVVYDLSTVKELSDIVHSSNECIKSAVGLLSTYAKNNEKDLQVLQTLMHRNLMDECSIAAEKEKMEAKLRVQRELVERNQTELKQQQEQVRRQQIKLDRQQIKLDREVLKGTIEDWQKENYEKKGNDEKKPKLNTRFNEKKYFQKILERVKLDESVKESFLKYYEEGNIEFKDESSDDMSE